MLSYLASRRQPSTHAHRLETWLGAEKVAEISRHMRGFPTPVAIQGVPGAVFATGDGDFIGEIHAGQEMSALDRAADAARRLRRKLIASSGRNRHALNAFANLSALIAAMTGGKAQYPMFQKTGVASNAIGNANDLWTRAGQPSAGAAGSAAPGGKAWTNADVGALKWANPVNANTGHFVGGSASASVAQNTLLLYDRLLSVAKTMNSSASEAVSGTFSRYQSATATAEDFIGGNFCFPANPTTVLAATAHNWTPCQYTDEAGNTANSFPSIAGVSACVVGGVDLAAGSWFMPLAAGDFGVKALTQMQCSALVATGTIDFVVGHAIAWLPCALANMVCMVDGVNTALNFTRIYDNACLSMLEAPKPATTATSYFGQLTLVAE